MSGLLDQLREWINNGDGLPEEEAGRGTGDIPSMSNTEAYIIRQLISEERYGLDLVKSSEGRLKRGTIYVTLNRMEDKGFVESRRPEEVPAHGGLPRPLYKATGKGVRVLRAKEIGEAAARLAWGG